MRRSFKRAAAMAAATLAIAMAADAQTRVERQVLASGAANAAGGAVRMKGSLGQPVIGRVGGATSLAGQGFWYAMPGLQPSAVDVPFSTTGTRMLQSATPNPFSATTTLRVLIPVAGPARLTLYDMLGREIKVLLDAQREAGVCTVVLVADDLPVGSYRAQLSVAGGEESMMLLVVR